jgi:hypothetical protein
MTLRMDARPAREVPRLEILVQDIKSAIIPSVSPKSTPAWIGGMAGASWATTAYSELSVTLVGTGMAGILASCCSCHEMEDAIRTADEKATVDVALVNVETKVVLLATGVDALLNDAVELVMSVIFPNLVGVVLRLVTKGMKRQLEMQRYTRYMGDIVIIASHESG